MSSVTTRIFVYHIVAETNRCLFVIRGAERELTVLLTALFPVPRWERQRTDSGRKTDNE